MARRTRERREVLVVRGRLDRGGRFVPRGCRSTFDVHSWPVVEEKELRIELLDADGRVLHREWAEVRPEIDCGPGDARTFQVTAYIELRDDAEVVSLVRDEIILWQREIPPRPELSIDVAVGRSRREGDVRLRLKFDEPGPGASMRVAYKWGKRRFRVVYVGPPAEELSFSKEDLPGGEECLFAVDYSNGLRSAQAATRPFRIEPKGPRIDMISPQPDSAITAGIPVVLQAAVLDEERSGGATDEDVVWSVDGREVARGFITSIDSLDEGKHEVLVAYQGSKPVRVVRQVRSRRAEAPLPDEWPEWDPMNGGFESRDEDTNDPGSNTHPRPKSD